MLSRCRGWHLLRFLQSSVSWVSSKCRLTDKRQRSQRVENMEAVIFRSDLLAEPEP